MKKFFAVIGNPPYQDESNGDQKNFAPPIYNSFMDEAYKVSEKVALVTPARFLFNAGSTPKKWNEKMLEDEHLKVLKYEPDASQAFPNTDIKGGIVVTLRDEKKNFGPIGTFTAFEELNGILKRIRKLHDESLMQNIFIQIRFDLEKLFAMYPNTKKNIGSEGKDSRFEKNIFTKVSMVFSEEKKKNDDIKVLGIIDNKRKWRFVSRKLVDLNHSNLSKYKVLIPTSNGSGSFGEILSQPVVGKPFEGFTRSFIGVGAFDTEEEAKACLKYIKTRFLRTMLGVLKITQDNNKDTWKYVPLQDFTSKSDIDWSKSIHEIDLQLYKKYGLNKEEQDFIESHVKEMV